MGLDPTFHFDADPDSSFQIMAQHLEKVLKKAYIPYISACHLQFDVDLDPAHHFDAVLDSDPAYHYVADPDLDPTVPFNLMRINADLDPRHYCISSYVLFWASSQLASHPPSPP